MHKPATDLPLGVTKDPLREKSSPFPPHFPLRLLEEALQAVTARADAPATSSLPPLSTVPAQQREGGRGADIAVCAAVEKRSRSVPPPALPAEGLERNPREVILKCRCVGFPSRHAVLFWGRK